MVDDTTSRKQFERAIETGADNGQCFPDAEGWCSHINVEVLSISPVGQMVGVPIGPHRISCKHAKHSIESVALRRLFQGFLIDNCVDCPHYKPGPRAVYGKNFLEDFLRETRKREEADAARDAEVERLRNELTKQARQQSEKNLDQSASIARLTIELFGGANHDTTKELCDACQIAPHLFSTTIVELIVLGAQDDALAEKCLPVLAALARNKSDLAPKLANCFVQSVSLPIPLEVIAEGVETPEQLEYLAQRGCQQFQGYYFSPPVSPKQILDLAISDSRPSLNAHRELARDNVN